MAGVHKIFWRRTPISFTGWGGDQAFMEMSLGDELWLLIDKKER